LDEVLNHRSHEKFLSYYAEQSQSARQLERFRLIRDTVLRVKQAHDQKHCTYDVLDVGCGAGTQCAVWSEAGHNVHGLDINEPLLDLAKERATAAGRKIDLRLGSAVKLPWPDESMDVCLALELLEHVSDWRSCLDEFARVLRPGGVLYFSTTNKMCPKQEEFNLLGYSWYPRRIKNYCERLAVTTRPAIANYAVYPAVNWFTPFSLRADLVKRGLTPMDRFDLIDTSRRGKLAEAIVMMIRRQWSLRWLAFVLTPSSTLVGIKASR
jgi:2-polyprenyl-6-hydroxyphenyl methylase/3-demethylubiquinone-9 3-methyltransferase